MKKKVDNFVVKKYGFLTLFMSMVICFMVGLLAVCAEVKYVKNNYPRFEMENGTLYRSYEEIFNQLDEIPDNFYEIAYKENLPDIVKSDIDLLVSEMVQEVIYSAENGSSEIHITKDYECENGYCMYVYSNNSYSVVECLNSDISMYKDDDLIIVLGLSYYSGRHLLKYDISADSVYTDFVYDISGDIDLLGVYDEDDNVDNVSFSSPNMTLVRIGQDFMLYHLGNQVGETATFPGDEIKEYDYKYILDARNDLYYMYYSTNEESPWIKFIKVADSIESIIPSDIETLNSEVEEGEQVYKMTYPIYIKDNERHASIPNDFETEITYINNHGNERNKVIENLDFSFTDLNMNAVNQTNISLHLEADNYVSGRYGDWYVHFNYEAGGKKLYVKERVNGLDVYLLRFIPEEEIARFDGRKMKDAFEVMTVLNELKDLYEMYE